jgi:Protein of unknown function (DUF4229)
VAEGPGGKTTTERGLGDVIIYAVARLVLLVVVSAAIYWLALLVGVTDFPLVVAVLFALIIAMPMGIWLFSPLRRRATAALAVSGERRRRERDQLRARLRGEALPEGTDEGTDEVLDEEKAEE